MTTEALIDRNMVFVLAEAAVKQHPGQTNPMINDTCLNTDYDDPAWHCIAAQVLVDLGHASALQDADPEDVVLETLRAGRIYDLFDTDARMLLSDLQNDFDTASHKGDSWSQAWEFFLKREDQREAARRAL